MDLSATISWVRLRRRASNRPHRVGRGAARASKGKYELGGSSSRPSKLNIFLRARSRGNRLRQHRNTSTLHAAAVLLAFTFVVLQPADVRAWGRDGHFIVGDIATRLLSDAARKAASELLPGESFSDVAVWADDVRRTEAYRYTAPYHYVNLEPGSESFDLERDCPSNGCVVQAILDYSAVLRDGEASKSKKQEALKFIVHFVGDIHQPLHVSPRGDRGGNDIQVRILGGSANLHSVWDSRLIATLDKPWKQLADQLYEQIDADEKSSWAGVDPIVWANESYHLSLPPRSPLGELRS